MEKLPSWVPGYSAHLFDGGGRSGYFADRKNGLRGLSLYQEIGSDWAAGIEVMTGEEKTLASFRAEGEEVKVMRQKGGLSADYTRSSGNLVGVSIDLIWIVKRASELGIHVPWTDKKAVEEMNKEKARLSLSVDWRRNGPMCSIEKIGADGAMVDGTGLVAIAANRFGILSDGLSHVLSGGFFAKGGGKFNCYIYLDRVEFHYEYKDSAVIIERIPRTLRNEIINLDRAVRESSLDREQILEIVNEVFPL